MLIVSQEGKVIKSMTNNLDELSTSVITETFDFKAPEDLNQYSVKLILGNQNKVFDELSVDYEKIEVEKALSSDGKIYYPNKEICFDNGVCTDIEKSLGNCYDCSGAESESEPPTESKLFLYAVCMRVIKHGSSLKIVSRLN